MISVDDLSGVAGMLNERFLEYEKLASNSADSESLYGFLKGFADASNIANYIVDHKLKDINDKEFEWLCEEINDCAKFVCPRNNGVNSAFLKGFKKGREKMISKNNMKKLALMLKKRGERYEMMAFKAPSEKSLYAFMMGLTTVFSIAATFIEEQQEVTNATEMEFLRGRISRIGAKFPIEKTDPYRNFLKTERKGEAAGVDEVIEYLNLMDDEKETEDA